MRAILALFFIMFSTTAYAQSQISPEIEKCVKQVFGDRAETILGNLNQLNGGENEQLKTCMGSSSRDQGERPSRGQEGERPTPPSGEMDGSVEHSDRPSDRPSGESSFGQLDQNTDACVKQALGEERFTAIGKGESPNDDDKSKVGSCFSGRHDENGDRNGPTVAVDPAIEECMKSALGDRFETLKKGTEPSDSDKAASMECFKKSGKEHPEVETNQKMSSSVMQCMKLAVGEKRFSEVSSGATPTLEDRQAGEKCFGASSGVVHQNVEVKLDSMMENCFKKAIGDSRFNEISQGSVPTEDERTKGQSCFSKDSSTGTSAAILPPAAKEVPYLSPKPETISVDAVEPIVQTFGIAPAFAQGNTPKITLKGKGVPKGVVDIYVFSEPIHLSTQADEKGNWTYTIERDLPSGNHTAYAVTKLNGKNVRSKETSFTIAQATTTSPTPTSVPTSTSSQNEKKNSPNIIRYGIFGIAFIVLIGVLWLVVGLLRHSHESFPSQK